MSRSSVRLPVDADRAFELLEDPRALRALVAGTRRIRRFDPRWPEPGSTVHHSVGVPPLVLRDLTVVTDCNPGRRLVLEARLHFLGTLTVEFELAPHGSGSVLTISEHPASGAISLPVVRRLVEAGTAARNARLGRRFVKLVQKRERVAASSARSTPSTGQSGHA